MPCLPIKNAIPLVNYGTLPDGVRYLSIAYDGSYQEYKDAPAAVDFLGEAYGKSSHNSDTGMITYRTDKKFAIKKA